MENTMTISFQSPFKSPNTRPLNPGFCNVPINLPDAARDILDAQRGDESRNAFLLRLLIEGLKAKKAEASADFESVLKSYGRPVASFGLLLIVLSQVAFGSQLDIRRTSTSVRVQTVRTVRGREVEV